MYNISTRERISGASGPLIVVTSIKNAKELIDAYNSLYEMKKIEISKIEAVKTA